MKKLSKKMLLIVMTVLMTCAMALTGCGGTENPCTGHVDADGNGKCDVCEETMVVPTPETPCAGHKDVDVDGKCDLCGDTMYVAPDPSATPEDTYVLGVNETAAGYTSFDMATMSTTGYDGKLTVTMTLSINAKAERIGTIEYTWVFTEKWTELMFPQGDQPVGKVVDKTYAGETKTSTATVTWRYNEDWPTYEAATFVANIDGSADGFIEAQKAYFTFNSTASTYSGAVIIKGYSATVTSNKIGKVATLTGETKKGETAMGKAAVKLTMYNDGTASLVADDGLYGLMSGVAFDGKGLWQKTLIGYTVNIGEIEIKVLLDKGIYTATNVSLGLGEDTFNLAYDSANVTMEGTCIVLADPSNPSVEAAGNITLAINLNTKEARLTIIMDADGQGYMVDVISETGGGHGGLAIGVGTVAAVEGQEGKYTATWNYKVADVDMPAYVVNFEVDENGVYTAQVAFTGMLKEAATVTNAG